MKNKNQGYMTKDWSRSNRVRNEEKLKEAKKCCPQRSSYKGRGYTQEEIDCLFKTVVLSKITYGLSVYAAIEPDLLRVQIFPNWYHMRSYCSTLLSVHELLETSDKQIYRKLYSLLGHLMRSLMPMKKETNYNLRRPQLKSLLSKTNDLRTALETK